MKENPKRAWDTNEESKSCAGYWRKNRTKENPKSAWDVNVTIKWRSILKVREIQTY